MSDYLSALLRVVDGRPAEIGPRPRSRFEDEAAGAPAGFLEETLETEAPLPPVTTAGPRADTAVPPAFAEASAPGPEARPGYEGPAFGPVSEAASSDPFLAVSDDPSPAAPLVRETVERHVLREERHVEVVETRRPPEPEVADEAFAPAFAPALSQPAPLDTPNALPSRSDEAGNRPPAGEPPAFRPVEIAPAPFALLPERDEALELNEAAPAPPAVLVSIGRLDVRFAPTETAPTRPSRPRERAGSGPSLGDYLAGRSGGR